jgi:hypothetical protein
MTRPRWILAAVALLLLVLFWREILAAAGALFLLALLKRHLYGGARGRRSSLAQTITAAAAAYTAWNARWIGISARANRSTSQGSWLERDDIVGLSEEQR